MQTQKQLGDGLSNGLRGYYLGYTHSLGVLYNINIKINIDKS